VVLVGERDQAGIAEHGRPTTNIARRRAS
jgi:hypothetical protein